jgi:hypothetical protein
MTNGTTGKDDRQLGGLMTGGMMNRRDMDIIHRRRRI